MKVFVNNCKQAQLLAALVKVYSRAIFTGFYTLLVVGRISEPSRVRPGIVTYTDFDPT